ncbi:helix-turn-helix transcriptional regulator [Aeromicrobium sp. Sec7.5]|uniref:helix-turn-helix transcriptional regulator n=1 Tax=Aeromicrobium sp. Sec7.5 TaxID=3121276 RepID=UPI002FE467A2
MAIEIALVIEGVNLLSDEFDEQVLPKFPDVQWESRAGATLAILHVDSSPVEAACTFSRILEHSGLGAVTAVFDDFVNTTEIAQRVDVSRELVRNWVLGSRGPGGFPPPHHEHGIGGSKGPMKVWNWAAVNSWLAQIGLDDGLVHLTPPEIAEIDAHLHRLVLSPALSWSEFGDSSAGQWIRAGVAAASELWIVGDCEYSEPRQETYGFIRAVGIEGTPATSKTSRYSRVFTTGPVQQIDAG